MSFATRMLLPGKLTAIVGSGSGSECRQIGESNTLCRMKAARAPESRARSLLCGSAARCSLDVRMSAYSFAPQTEVLADRLTFLGGQRSSITGARHFRPIVGLAYSRMVARAVRIIGWWLFGRSVSWQYRARAGVTHRRNWSITPIALQSCQNALPRLICIVAQRLRCARRACI